jgi:hypothetical protein
MNHDISQSNSKKLDEIIILVRGEEGAPGVLRRLAEIEDLLRGKEGHGGLIMKVNSMWRAHVWLLCTLSAAVGFLLREFFTKIVKL